MNKVFWIIGITVMVVIVWVSWEIANEITRAVQPNSISHYIKTVKESSK